MPNKSQIRPNDVILGLRGVLREVEDVYLAPGGLGRDYVELLGHVARSVQLPIVEDLGFNVDAVLIYFQLLLLVANV